MKSKEIVAAIDWSKSWRDPPPGPHHWRPKNMPPPKKEPRPKIKTLAESKSNDWMAEVQVIPLSRSRFRLKHPRAAVDFDYGRTNLYAAIEEMIKVLNYDG